MTAKLLINVADTGTMCLCVCVCVCLVVHSKSRLWDYAVWFWEINEKQTGRWMNTVSMMTFKGSGSPLNFCVVCIHAGAVRSSGTNELRCVEMHSYMVHYSWWPRVRPRGQKDYHHFVMALIKTGKWIAQSGGLIISSGWEINYREKQWLSFYLLCSWSRLSGPKLPHQETT